MLFVPHFQVYHSTFCLCRDKPCVSMLRRQSHEPSVAPPFLTNMLPDPVGTGHYGAFPPEQNSDPGMWSENKWKREGLRNKLSLRS